MVVHSGCILLVPNYSGRFRCYYLSFGSFNEINLCNHEFSVIILVDVVIFEIKILCVG